MTDDAIAATTITALEAGARARLSAKITDGFAIEAFPDDLKKYALLNQRGAFLVGYSGALYQPSKSGSWVAQERKMQISITALCRQLSGHDGVYEMIERARVALLGFALPGFDPLFAVSEKFLGQAQGVNSFVLVLATATLAIEADDDSGDPPIATLQRVTVQPASDAIGDTLEVPST